MTSTHSISFPLPPFPNIFNFSDKNFEQFDQDYEDHENNVPAFTTIHYDKKGNAAMKVEKQNKKKQRTKKETLLIDHFFIDFP